MFIHLQIGKETFQRSGLQSQLVRLGSLRHQLALHEMTDVALAQVSYKTA